MCGARSAIGDSHVEVFAYHEAHNTQSYLAVFQYTHCNGSTTAAKWMLVTGTSLWILYNVSSTVNLLYYMVIVVSWRTEQSTSVDLYFIFNVIFIVILRCSSIYIMPHKFNTLQRIQVLLQTLVITNYLFKLCAFKNTRGSPHKIFTIKISTLDYSNKDHYWV